MKKFIFFILFVSMATQMNAQLSWTIRLGSKTLLRMADEDESKNVLRLNNSQIGKNNLTLTYRITHDEKDWKRTLMIYDTAGISGTENPMASKIKKGTVTVTYTVSNKILKELLAKYKKIKIYFTSLPSDPEKAALVRVRKVHICTVSIR